MRSWLVVLVAVACGPSASEIKTAKTASYNTTPAHLLEIAEQVAQESYKLGDVEADGFATQPQFYSSEGGMESAGAGGYVQVRAGSVRVTLHVKVIENAAHQVMVTVTPETYQMVEGSPQPRQLAPDDP